MVSTVPTIDPKPDRLRIFGYGPVRCGGARQGALHQFEEGETSWKADRLIDDLPLFSVAVKREAAEPVANDALSEALEGLSPDEMTPREALDALYRLKGLAAS